MAVQRLTDTALLQVAAGSCAPVLLCSCAPVLLCPLLAVFTALFSNACKSLSPVWLATGRQVGQNDPRL